MARPKIELIKQLRNSPSAPAIVELLNVIKTEINDEWPTAKLDRMAVLQAQMQFINELTLHFTRSLAESKFVDGGYGA